ncbi:MAG: TRAP transporter small permease, partial [Gammaproteobacteria bacterium]|nr:TRAP transporter small permease [Gammaproteobacteria bacterium]
MALMLITCIDVFGRYLFNNPLTGSTELTEIAVGIVIFSVFPIVSWRNDHVVVDILDHFFSRRVHMIRTIVINLLISVALVFLGQRIYVLGQRSLSYGEVTEYLAIPLGWMMIFIAIMCWVTALAVVT